VVLSWTQPELNYGGITAYKINIINSAGTAVEETTYCDGLASAILASRTCQVPMAYIRTQYGLVRGATIEARVQAQGLNGWGAWSTNSVAGVTVQTEPGQGNTPTEGSQTSEAQVEVQWAALTTSAETGDSPITSYNLEYHVGSTDPTATWLDLAGEASEYTSTSYILTTGVVAARLTALGLGRATFGAGELNPTRRRS
jgi:hypothetical protein